MKKFILIPLVISVAFNLTACSRSDSDSKALDPHQKTYEGDVFQKAQEIYQEMNSESFYECDSNQISTILKLAKTIEDKREKIIELNKKRISDLDSNIRQYKIGPHEFYDPTSTEEFEDKWYEERHSWKDVNEIYEKIAADSESDQWVSLNGYVRSLIVEDSRRIEGSFHHNIQRQLKTTVLNTYNIIKKCHDDSTCTLPAFTEETLSWLNSDVYYKLIYKRLQSDAIEFNKKRKWINWLRGRLDSSIKRFYLFEKNGSITVDSNKVILPLNLDIFAVGINQIKQLIEDSWSKFGISIQVAPTSNADEIFRISISNMPNERVFVSFEEKLVQLYSPTRSRTLIHEMGHVLGLSERYYTWFNPDTCEYIYEANDADIMSTSTTGKVLPSHIEEIKKAYLN